MGYRRLPPADLAALLFCKADRLVLLHVGVCAGAAAPALRTAVRIQAEAPSGPEALERGLALADRVVFRSREFSELVVVYADNRTEAEKAVAKALLAKVLKCLKEDPCVKDVAYLSSYADFAEEFAELMAPVEDGAPAAAPRAPPRDTSAPSPPVAPGAADDPEGDEGCDDALSLPLRCGTPPPGLRSVLRLRCDTPPHGSRSHAGTPGSSVGYQTPPPLRAIEEDAAVGRAASWGSSSVALVPMDSALTCSTLALSREPSVSFEEPNGARSSPAPLRLSFDASTLEASEQPAQPPPCVNITHITPDAAVLAPINAAERTAAAAELTLASRRRQAHDVVFRRMNESALAAALSLNAPAEVVDGLYVGNAQTAACRRQLAALQVTHVVNVSVEVPNVYPSLFTYTRVRLQDAPRHARALRESFDSVCAAIHTARRAGGVVLVHCLVGASRSCAVVAAYLMRCLGWPRAAALAHISGRRPAANVSDALQRALVAYEDELARRERCEVPQVQGEICP
eukprot:TRINITY_DN688_c1_g2_i1.p1 TRINITY_DN688_c1_g2~~TRINITY_DN688_c1_g2_i1.p1  ORF type:complete len:514 (+),score=127.84 TRINITY_DN688_c1_g2_i1:93-1634(+)